MFKSAKQAEVIRSTQKDYYYSGYIKASLAEIVQSWIGAGTWIRWRKEFELACDVGYFCLTTIAGYQTLGEEYVNIVQVDSSQRKVPSTLVRSAMIGLQVGLPYAIDKVLSLAEKWIFVNTSLRHEAKEGLLKVIPALRHLITIIHRCHIAAFYMHGIFYHLAKRITGVHYILAHLRGEDNQRNIGYNLLAWLALLQLVLSLVQQMYTLFTKPVKSVSKESMWTEGSAKQSLNNDSSSASDTHIASRKCSLCLGVRSHSTATPCGHMFCWECIMEWCTNKPECPLCREQSPPSRLIFLQNYDIG